MKSSAVNLKVGLLLIGALLCGSAVAEFEELTDEDFEAFDDRPLPEPLGYPSWFKLSFLDLPEDLNEAVAAGKQGLLIYFGQKYCAYCKALLEVNFGKPDIVSYTRERFDVLGVDIHGDRTVVDIDGREINERQLAAELGIDFTPTVVVYNAAGEEALRLSGYYPPYKFRAALEYVSDGYYANETFRQYLARAGIPMAFEEGSLNFAEFFMPPPHALDRSVMRGHRHLLVIFEQPDCHACDVLHTGPFQDPEIRRRLYRMDVEQLSLWRKTPVITPGGDRTTAREWAATLNLFYAPTMIFFDEHGREVVRVDSVVQFYRLRNVLDYVLTRGYEKYPTFQQWRENQSQASARP